MSLSLLFEVRQVVYLYSYQDCVVHNQKMWKYIYRKNVYDNLIVYFLPFIK
jgi:hypothetical protein